MMFFIARRRKKSRENEYYVKTREEKSLLGTFAATSFIISLTLSFSVASARLCSSLSLSLSLCLLFFRASKNLSFFCEEQFVVFLGCFFGFFFGCFFSVIGWSRTEKEKKFWIGHVHTSQILLSPPIVYLFTEHTALLCTPHHHQRRHARLLLKSLL